MILSHKIKLHKNFLPFIRKLIKEKQHFRNNLILLFEKSKDFAFLDYSIIRVLVYNTAGGKKADLIKEIKSKHKELLSEFDLTKFAFLKNKIVEEIVKELNGNYSTGFKLVKQKIIEKFSIKTKKISKVKSGSILIPSEAIGKIKSDDKLNLTIYSKKHTKGIKFSINLPEISECEKDIRCCTLSFNREDCYLIIHYEEKEISLNDSFTNFLSIDPGMNNHLTIFISGKDPKSFLIRSASINRINASTARLTDKLFSEIDNAKNNKENSSKIEKLISKKNFLFRKREVIIRNEIHKICRRILDCCLKYKVGGVIYGFNKNQKKEVNLGKKNNREFLQFPHEILKNNLLYLLSLNGINLILQEESYTSKLSCLSDKVWKYSYGGLKPTESSGLRGVTINKKKIHSLFRDKKLNFIFHSDVNGAINILRKYLKDDTILDSCLTNEALFNPILIKNDFQFLNILRRTEKAS